MSITRSGLAPNDTLCFCNQSSAAPTSRDISSASAVGYVVYSMTAAIEPSPASLEASTEYCHASQLTQIPPGTNRTIGGPPSPLRRASASPVAVAPITWPGGR